MLEASSEDDSNNSGQSVGCQYELGSLRNMSVVRFQDRDIFAKAMPWLWCDGTSGLYESEMHGGFGGYVVATRCFVEC